MKLKQIKLIGILVVLLLQLSCKHEYCNPRSTQHTSPSRNNTTDTGEHIRLFILSDWGWNGSNTQQMVAQSMQRYAAISKPQCIITCGDNFQYLGVSSVHDSLWQINYENVYTKQLQVPWYVTLGNHDHYGNFSAEIEYSSINHLWHLPAQYYSFTQAIANSVSVRIIVLDTQALLDSYNSLTDTNRFDTIAQYRWLTQQLSEMHEKWSIVVGHHPVFSASPVHGDTKELKKIIKPLFNQYAVDFYLCGHDHNFEHAKEPNQKTDYFVIGTGGNIRNSAWNEHTIAAFSELGFGCFDITDKTAKISFISTSDSVKYTFTKGVYVSR